MTMKTTFLPSFEVCDIEGNEHIVDMLLAEADDDSRMVLMFVPGTTETAPADSLEFHDNEIQGWWDHAMPHMREAPCVCEPCTTDPGGNCVNCLRPAGPVTNLDRFVELAGDLIRADERREDTGNAARALREFIVDTLKRPDPLGLIPSDMPTLATVTEPGELIGQSPCGRDNNGCEEEYEYEGHRYIVGWEPGKDSWFYRKEEE